MAKTQPLPLRLGFQGEPNTPKSCYQIVTKIFANLGSNVAYLYIQVLSFTYWGTASIGTDSKMSKTKLVGDVKVTLCLTEEEGLDVLDGGKWLLMCENHGGIIQGTNKSRLWGFASTPEQFCDGCRNAKAGA